MFKQRKAVENAVVSLPYRSAEFLDRGPLAS